MHLVLSDTRDLPDLRGWECQIGIPQNVRVLDWTLPGSALNVYEAPEFMVGLGVPMPIGDPVVLATARCVALDDQPALFHLRPVGTPSVAAEALSIAVDDGENGIKLYAAGTASGDPADPVFGVNASVEMNARQPLPERFALHAGSPNPFNPQTVIRFDVPTASQVELAVYAVNGRKVATLVSEAMNPGSFDVVWRGEDDNGRRLASGVYFCRMVAGAFEQTQQMVLLK